MHSFFTAVACSQSLTVDDLLTLSSLSPKSFDNYVNKKGFMSVGKSLQNDAIVTTFFEKNKAKEIDTLHIIRSVDLYKKDDTYYFALHTSSSKEYMEGREQLKKAGFFCSNSGDTNQLSSLLFQKKNITVQASAATEDGEPVFTFLLQKKELASLSSIRYAEDLLKFNSHEYLVSSFGVNNVKKDVYYFSEKELRKCSVLFANTNQQAVFIWDDQTNLCNLSYILISGILPTQNTAKFSGSISQNKWVMKNGIYSGMSIKELLKLNGNDFEFYGRNSEFSFMIVPQHSGNIDFKKTGIMLGCINCNGSALLDNLKVSAIDALNNSLALHIFYIMITP